MVRNIYGVSVQGASHIRSGTVCQDSFKQLQLSDDISILAVADGHGSSACPYSKTGSKIAVNVFCAIMQDLLNGFADNPELLLTYLNREGELTVAQDIDTEWKRRVWKAHIDNKREKPLKEDGETDKAAVYKQYGTTLLGMLITSQYMFAFQLGDGDMVYVDADGVQSIIEGDKILGIETHSLCKLDAWKKSISMIRMREKTKEAHLFMISTDGFSNSYRTQEEYFVSCKDYYSLIQQYGFDSVTENMKEWLKETSELGCGDDITLALVYFEPEEVLEG
ncbi:MAG: protein phosphatase 2C domain-containing protein [Peptococcaceae bacterium]|nr:protein phosphatase 2C domain-containing protein [Peptococcaceae bacterium]